MPRDKLISVICIEVEINMFVYSTLVYRLTWVVGEGLQNEDAVEVVEKPLMINLGERQKCIQFTATTNPL